MKRNLKFKIAVFIGKGGRLKSIYNCLKKIPNAKIVLVLSDKKTSPGVEWAKKRKISSFCFPLSNYLKNNLQKSREDFNLELVKIVKKEKVNFIILAGWDIVLSKSFLNAFKNKVVNIHPSLLPSFPGLESEKQALDYGVKYTGCTLHFVDEGVDTGPIIFQEPVKIENKETIKTLQEKIHKKEEKILCLGIKAICQGRIKIYKRRVFIN